MTFRQLLAAFTLTISMLPAAAVVVVAQSGEATAPPETAQAELGKKAFAMLDEAVTEAPALKLPENRIRVQLTAAGLLWERDEPRARALFKAAVSDLVAVIAKLDPTDPQYYGALDAVTQLRFQMLEAVARHDARLALEFLHATRQPLPINFNPEYIPQNQELVLAMNLASQLAAQDPKQALRMAEESLSKGVTSNTLNVMQQLREKEPESATKLATAIARQLRQEDLSRNPDALGVLTSLLGLTRPPAPDPNAAQNSETHILTETNATQPALVNEQTRRELLEMAVTLMIDAPPNRIGNIYAVYSTLKEVLPEAEKALPTRVAALRRKMSEFENFNSDPRAKLWKEYESVRQGSVDVMVEAASKAPPEMSETLYAEAAWKAFGENDVERARQIAAKVSNPQQRAQMLRAMERQLSERAAAEGRFDAARQVLAQLKTTEERVMLLLQLAEMAVSKKDLDAARGFLGEARGQIGARAGSYSEFSLLLQIAQSYAAFEPSQSFEIVDAAIDHLNELISAAAVVDGFGQQSFVEGEMKPQGAYMWNELVSSCAASLARLAHIDFERAQTVTQKFQRPEVRTMTRLLVAQGLLNELMSADEQARNVIRRPIRRGMQTVFVVAPRVTTKR